MSDIVKNTVKTITHLEDLSLKLRDFEDFEDMNELIEIMNYGSRIESVLKWLDDFDKKSPSKIYDGEWKMKDYSSQPLSDYVKKIAEELKEATPVPSKYLPKFADELPRYTGKGVNVIPTLPKIAIEEPETISTYEPCVVPTAPDNVVDEAVVSFIESTSGTDDEVEEEWEYVDEPLTLASYAIKKENMEKIIANYEKQEWLKLDKNSKWRRYYKHPFMVSNTGRFFSLFANAERFPAWINGDLRLNVALPGELVDYKRAAIIVAASFGIKRNPAVTDKYVIDFKDGNRRNLNVDNLTHSQEATQLSPQIRLAHDICQLCVKHDFNVSKIMKEYEDSEPAMYPSTINKVINKEYHASISDAYWLIGDDGKPVKIAPRKPSGFHVNIADLIIFSKDIRVCSTLLHDKIDAGFELTPNDKEILVNIGKRNIPAKDRTATSIANYIKNNYNWNITMEEVKGYINKPTKITKVMEGIQ